MTTAALRPGRVLDRPADAVWRTPLGAHRGLSAGAVDAGQPVLPRRPGIQWRHRSTAWCRTTPSASRSTRCGRIRSGTTLRRAFSGTFDLKGDGKSVIKASWGKYLDQINTGTPPNPNANINQTYAWNDLNGDFIFQKGNAAWNGSQYVGGEFGALQQTNNLAVATFDKTRAASVSRGNQRQLRSRAVPRRAGERRVFPLARARPAGHRSIRTSISGGSCSRSTTLTDPGRDGVLGTGDDAPIEIYNQNQTGHGDLTGHHQRRPARAALRRPRLHGRPAAQSSGWQLLAGYTFSTTKVDATSLIDAKQRVRERGR